MAASVLFGQLSYFLTASALSLYLHHHGAPEARVGLDVGIGSVAALLCSVVAGPLLNRKGPRTFLMAGSGLYILAALVMLTLPFEASITAGRILQGVGLAIVGPAASAAVPLLAPARIGSAVGIMTTVSSVPLAVGPAVGLVLYTQGGPLWLFIPTMAIGLIGVGIGAALSMPAEPHAPEPASGFGYDRRWTAGLVANCINGIYFGGILAYLPLFMAQIHGPNAGIFFTADAVGVVVLRIPSGMLADRTRPAVPMLLGLAITILGLAAFAPHTSTLSLIAAGAGTGIGAGLFANGLLTDLLGLSSRRNRGTAMSLSFATAGFGVFVGSSISGLLFAPAGFGGIILFGAVCEAVGIPIVALAGYSWRWKGTQ